MLGPKSDSLKKSLTKIRTYDLISNVRNGGSVQDRIWEGVPGVAAGAGTKRTEHFQSRSLPFFLIPIRANPRPTSLPRQALAKEALVHQEDGEGGRGSTPWLHPSLPWGSQGSCNFKQDSCRINRSASP